MNVNIPVVVITGYEENEFVIFRIEMEMVEYMQKDEISEKWSQAVVLATKANLKEMRDELDQINSVRAEQAKILADINKMVSVKLEQYQAVAV